MSNSEILLLIYPISIMLYTSKYFLYSKAIKLSNNDLDDSQDLTNYDFKIFDVSSIHETVMLIK